MKNGGIMVQKQSKILIFVCKMSWKSYNRRKFENIMDIKKLYHKLNNNEKLTFVKAVDWFKKLKRVSYHKFIIQYPLTRVTKFETTVEKETENLLYKIIEYLEISVERQGYWPTLKYKSNHLDFNDVHR